MLALLSFPSLWEFSPSLLLDRYRSGCFTYSTNPLTKPADAMGLTHQQKRSERERQRRAGVWKPAPTPREYALQAKSLIDSTYQRHREGGRLWRLRWGKYDIETTKPVRWEMWLQEHGAKREDIEFTPVAGQGSAKGLG